jgi:hypothetical protein
MGEFDEFGWLWIKDFSKMREGVAEKETQRPRSGFFNESAMNEHSIIGCRFVWSRVR